MFTLYARLFTDISPVLVSYQSLSLYARPELTIRSRPLRRYLDTERGVYAHAISRVALLSGFG